MTVKDRKHPAPEIIATYLGCDINEVLEMVYQPARYRTPRVYSWDDSPWSYYCCPTERQKPPADIGEWEVAGEAWNAPGRPIYGIKYEKIAE